MGLLVNQNKTIFDHNEIKKGYLICAHHKSWSDGALQSGIVTSVLDSEVIVQYLPEIGNITNHYYIRADEVINGEWLIRCSKDLETIHCEGEVLWLH